ncbi:MAG: GAF domain-containing protein, partial [Sphingobacteriales bacterium]
LRFINYMEGSMNLQQLCARVAEEIRALTGYDRVMIYRFDKDYTGEIFAEAKRDDLESFFGLRYPATDIPVQARKLYETNLLRIIPNVAYTSVPLLTNADADNSSLDLSFSVLRSVSPIHVQYLLNMGVAATLTISLMHKDKLWGLIACHHYSEKYIDHNTRVLAQLQGNFITSQIEVRQQVEEFSISREMSRALDAMSELKPEPTPASIAFIASQPQLLQLCHATGVAIIMESEIFTQGKVPAEEDIRELENWLIQNNKQGSFYTHHLSSVFPEAKAAKRYDSNPIYDSVRPMPRPVVGCARFRVKWWRKMSCSAPSR